MPRNIGREFRTRLQEEARGGRITEDSFDEFSGSLSPTIRKFRKNALALDDGNFRIPGKSPQVLLEDCSLQEIAAETIVDRQGHPVGMSYVHEMFRPTEASARAHARMSRLREAGDPSAVDYTMFAGITGQLLINATLKGFEHEEFVFTQAAGTYNTQFVDGERIPGVSLPLTKDAMGYNTATGGPGKDSTEDVLLVKPQQPFPYLTMGSNYKDFPATELRGGIMGIDRLAIYGDRTGLVAANAAQGARILGIRKEQRGLQLLCGGVAGSYKEKYNWDTNGTVTLDAYQAAAGGGSGGQLVTTYPTRPFPFVNDIPNNPLSDYHAFEAADQAASKLVDPNDGLPITFGPKPVIFAPYTERFNIAVVLEAFNIWRMSAGGLSSTGGVNTVGPNVVRSQIGEVDPRLSRMLRQEMIKSGLYGDGAATGTLSANADKVWWYGDVAEAIKYNTNWNIKTIMAPANSEAEFNQDIVLRWRFDERGIWAWHQPRAIQRHNCLSQS